MIKLFLKTDTKDNVVTIAIDEGIKQAKKERVRQQQQEIKNRQLIKKHKR